MIVQSLRFGAIEADEKTVLRFKEGIPGFELLKRYIMVSCAQTEPIRWLQAVDDRAVSLPVIDPFIIYPEYHIDIDEVEMSELGGCEETDLIAYCVMVLPKRLVDCTVNLSAPIVINVASNSGKQMMLDYDLPNALRYPAFEALSKYFKEKQDSAGTD